MTPEFDAVIVGAGPTGLACGIELKRRGLKITQGDIKTSLHILDPDGFEVQIGGLKQ